MTLEDNIPEDPFEEEPETPLETTPQDVEEALVETEVEMSDSSGFGNELQRSLPQPLLRRGLTKNDLTKNELELLAKHAEEEDDDNLLNEDAYALLYTSRFCSRTNAFAWFSIMLQGGMIAFIFLDLFDIGSDPNTTNDAKNRMGIPAGSTVAVMVAQFLGILLTAMIMSAEGDLVIGVTQLIKGYDPRIMEQFPHATRGRWLLSGFLQSIVGMLLLFDSFILSMQSTTVIDLSLNLTALYFIQEIDDMAFKLALETGLLGSHVAADCKNVRNLKGFSTPAARRQLLMLRRCIILAMTIGLLVPYAVIISWQFRGRFTCEILYIQFGDEHIPDMAHYSGFFRSQGNRIEDRIGQRNLYVDDTKTFKVAFCSAENYWTISELEEDPCVYLFRSAETEAFDMIDAAEELDWMVNTEAPGVTEVDWSDWLKIVCNDCTEDTCPSDHGVCSEAGDKCECFEGRFGINCQFEEDCRRFALDQRTRDGLEEIQGTYSFLETEYTSLPSDLMFYDRPIYVPMNETSDFGDIVDDIDSFIIFTGRRWVLYAIPEDKLVNVLRIEGKPSNWSSYSFLNWFDELGSLPTSIDGLKNLTAENINYFPIFFSSPINHGESVSTFDPGAVTWEGTTPYDYSNNIIPAYPDEGQPVSARFLCSACTVDDDCMNAGYCYSGDVGTVGSCVCQAFYRGHRCERVKDCFGAGGCSNAGTCDRETRTCHCNKGSFGSLCQLGVGESNLPDPFLCDECRVWGNGKCYSTFSQECICADGYEGTHCDLPTTSNSFGNDEASSVNVTT